MSPTPRKPAKPKRPRKGAGADLAALLAKDGAPPPPRAPELAVRLDGAAPSAKALKAAGVDDERVLALAEHLGKRWEEISARLAGEPELAALLTTDPDAALAKLDVPEPLRTGGVPITRDDLLARFAATQLDLGQVTFDLDRPSPGLLAEVQLIADVFAAAEADPATQAALATDPTPVVAAVAASRPPAAVSTAAAASVVQAVTEELCAVYGVTPIRTFPGTSLAPGGRVIRFPRPLPGA